MCLYVMKIVILYQMYQGDDAKVVKLFSHWKNTYTAATL